ncbi:polymorphic toxin-type HINT domain-containing protein [Actinomadura kijaniata]|uniref:polymorphic toxin-type HINT domain-containing protein n=1 Tax=Actinomadura kijaniata TaxID=46161 RepID=UPI000A00C655|nr:polymorphic toxin-type HINT domain-containing protein [Actinomadura kijaniata]
MRRCVLATFVKRSLNERTNTLHRTRPLARYRQKPFRSSSRAISKHRATIAATAVGIGCGAAIGWTGAGGVACAAAAGAVYGMVNHAQHTPRDQWTAGGFLKAAAKGAITEVANHATGGLATKIAGPLLKRVIPKIASKIGGGSGKTAGGKRSSGDKVSLTKPSASATCKRSFVPGTPVLMANGSHKPIDKLQVGDKVTATNSETGKTQARTVTATFTSTGAKNLVQLTIDTDGTRGAKASTLTATDDHPFWVPGLGRWVEARELKPGMWLRTSVGTHVQITAIKTWAQHQRVHNLTVDTDHTYYVYAGGTAVLSHNACGHTAVVTVYDSAGRQRGGSTTWQSGNPIPEEKAQGRWKGNNLVTHTEARATRDAGSPYPYWDMNKSDDPLLGQHPAIPGDTYLVEGTLPPCISCAISMEQAAADTGTNWVYTWLDPDTNVRQWWARPANTGVSR